MGLIPVDREFPANRRDWRTGADGRSAVMSVGWIVVSFFTFSVALGMAEIVSAIPTSGGPYFWAAMLAPPKHSALSSWLTGW